MMVTRESETSEGRVRYPCECCGFRTLSDPATNSYEICPVCFWESDPVQNEDPSFAGGANAVSLVEARENYFRFGACESSLTDRVRPVRVDEVPSPPIIGGLDAANRRAALNSTKRLLAGITRSMLCDGIATLDGCAAIAGVAFPLDEPALDGTLRFFWSVSGESEDFPTGEVRRKWAPEALKIKDQEAADYESRVKGDVQAACKRLLQLLETDVH